MGGENGSDGRPLPPGWETESPREVVVEEGCQAGVPRGRGEIRVACLGLLVVSVGIPTLPALLRSPLASGVFGQGDLLLPWDVWARARQIHPSHGHLSGQRHVGFPPPILRRKACDHVLA